MDPTALTGRLIPLAAGPTALIGRPLVALSARADARRSTPWSTPSGPAASPLPLPTGTPTGDGDLTPYSRELYSGEPASIGSIPDANPFAVSELRRPRPPASASCGALADTSARSAAGVPWSPPAPTEGVWRACFRRRSGGGPEGATPHLKLGSRSWAAASVLN
eukprot:1189455-Prorocentrum_minimum.AAC.1